MDWYNGYSPAERAALGRGRLRGDAPAAAMQPPCAMCADAAPRRSGRTPTTTLAPIAGNHPRCIRSAGLAIHACTPAFAIPNAGGSTASFSSKDGEARTYAATPFLALFVLARFRRRPRRSGVRVRLIAGGCDSLLIPLASVIHAGGARPQHQPHKEKRRLRLSGAPPGWSSPGPLPSASRPAV
jgi:hypothetical protein